MQVDSNLECILVNKINARELSVGKYEIAFKKSTLILDINVWYANLALGGFW